MTRLVLRINFEMLSSDMIACSRKLKTKKKTLTCLILFKDLNLKLKKKCKTNLNKSMSFEINFETLLEKKNSQSQLLKNLNETFKLKKKRLQCLFKAEINT